ncbi:hypothetical protein BRADI_2g25760v3 [Brachypodium distachyon]|uniref:CW-type domain-containing protein n=1 Tax=Brachypodium distachyon TaxID=15368 RepID=A0A0Q3IKI6_BRADI|nr:hypothetical protein BRADI_2g25760v3 [Brachypodium distachyon]
MTVKGRRGRDGAGGELKPIWSGAREDKCPSGLEGLQGQRRTDGGAGSDRRRRHSSILQTPKGSGDSIAIYAIQCNECDKWRTIHTKQEFEMIRESYDEDPWVCGQAPGRSCKHPEDIQYDTSRIWVMDKAGIPRPPPETERLLIMRRDLSKMDTYYVMRKWEARAAWLRRGKVC